MNVSPEFEKFGKLALSVYATVGIGLCFTIFLFFTFAGEGAVTLGSIGGGSAILGSDIGLAGAADGAMDYTVFLSPLLALGIGFYVARTATRGTSPPVVSAAVNAGGLLATEIVLLLVAVIFAPEGVTYQIGEYIAPLIGLAIGVAVMGGAAGAIAERAHTW